MKGKRIIVTGGNRGIGLEIIRQLSKAGHEVIMAARNREQGNEIAKSLESKGYQVTFYPLDLSSPESIQSFANNMYNHYGHLDVLINNAAVFLDNGESSLSVNMEKVYKTMQINLYGPIDLSKTLLNLLKGSPQGRIINITSGLGAMSEMTGNHTAYRLSKVGLNAFTKIFSADLAGSNIRVNSMCPGWVHTDMGGEAAPRTVEQGADTAVWLATADEIPNGKFLRDRKEIEW